MMYQSLLRLAALALVLTLAACGGPDDDAAGEAATEPRTKTIRGTLSYVEQITLAPESVVTVRLIDLARADTPEGEIAKTEFLYPGERPVPFTLTYDTGKIDGSRQYGLLAEVKEQKRLMFISTEPQPVLHDESQPPVDMLLAQVPGGHLDRMPDKIRASNPELVGHYRYQDGEGQFTDCDDGEVHPVAREKAVFALESEYRDVAPRFGDEVFLRVAGKYVTRPARNGRGKEDFLIALQIEEMAAGLPCP